MLLKLHIQLPTSHLEIFDTDFYRWKSSIGGVQLNNFLFLFFLVSACYILVENDFALKSCWYSL